MVLVIRFGLLLLQEWALLMTGHNKPVCFFSPLYELGDNPGQELINLISVGIGGDFGLIILAMLKLCLLSIVARKKKGQRSGLSPG
jgi:hypothetical protein